MKIGSREFDTAHHTYVCGILNVTPDSFSDGGKWRDTDSALRQAERMAEQGAAILDIGGESSRPGYTPVSPEEELERVIPILRAVKERFDIPVSLDTCKAEVAREGLLAGADLINDIWGLRGDPDMAKVIAENGASCCLMHNRESAGYQDLMAELTADLGESLKIAQAAGIDRDKVILDPGIGFGKSYEDNMRILADLKELSVLGCPVLLGCSRKSVIGQTLDLPVSQREEGTLATTVLAVLSGISFIRVHDVEKNVRAIKMTEAILKRGGLRRNG